LEWAGAARAVLCVDRTPGTTPRRLRLGRLAQRPQPGCSCQSLPAPWAHAGGRPCARTTRGAYVPSNRADTCYYLAPAHTATLQPQCHTGGPAAARGEGPLRRLRRCLRAMRRHCSPPDGARAGQISRSRPLAGSWCGLVYPTVSMLSDAQMLPS
jgi:hypothetical protein